MHKQRQRADDGDARSCEKPDDKGDPLNHSAPPHQLEQSLTPELLAELWPKVVSQLASDLRYRRLDPDTIEDFCQDAFVKALVHRGGISPTLDDLRRWTRVVVRNDATKRLRRLERLAEGDVPEDQASASDVEREVVARDRLRAVLDAVKRLPPEYRVAVGLAVSEGDRGPTKREQDKVSLRLHRARQALRKVTGALGGWRFAEWRWRLVGSEAIVSAAATGVAAFMVAGLLALTPAKPGGSAKTGERPVEQASAAGPVLNRRAGSGVRSGMNAPSAPSGQVDGSRRPSEADRYQTHAVVRTVNGRPAVAVGTTERPSPDQPLVCYGSVPGVAPGCIPHPLRNSPNPSISAIFRNL